MRLTRPPIWLLAALPPLFWAGNFVLARALHADLPPLALSFWRWTLALGLLLPFGLPALWRQRALLGRHWRLLLILALFGITGYNTLVYSGLQETTASNALLLSSATPVLIVALSFLLLGERLRLPVLLGLALSLAGVWLIVSDGVPARLLHIGLSPGDAWVLVAALDWALYSVLLRRRPAGLSPVAFLTALVALGLPPLAGLYAWELSRGIGLTLNVANLAAIGYVALFPSVLAYVFWNRAVAELGANRTGQYMHLVPVFGILLGTLVLGERLAWFHALGAVLIAAGILASAQRSGGTGLFRRRD
ncbi:DMT family transporter [uncultured Thiohalocapsa sp.]|uniref:DMT family transporter n=1 Tax=uncultured Thiohalocapsa sp. TaxID=768990 RepID=UPI0025D635AC|nr:DMT family transporter [uncultured Thiohalocapsa sp.]